MGRRGLDFLSLHSANRETKIAEYAEINGINSFMEGEKKERHRIKERAL